MKIGRNEPCPCGSGKKYKHCCLEKEEEAHRFVHKVREEWSNNQFQENALEAWFDDWSYQEPEEDLEENDDEDWEKDDERLHDGTDWENSEDWEDEDLADEFDEDEDEEEVNEPDTQPASGFDHTAEEKFWDDFNDLDLDGKIAVFENVLAEPDTMKMYRTAEVLEGIFETALAAGARERYDVLIEKLYHAAPEAYRFNAATFLGNRLANAMALRRFETLGGLVKELAALAEEEPDSFEALIPKLSYYGRADLLNTALEIAWPLVSASKDWNDWVAEIFVPFAVRMAVFDHLDRSAASPGDDAALFQALEKFSKIPRPRLEVFMALLSGHAQRQWQAADFEIKRPASYPRGADEADDETALKTTIGQNVFNLSLQFQGYLRREHNIPYLESELGREQIVKYVFARALGELYPPVDLFVKPDELAEQYRLSHPEWPRHVRLLCPDRVTLAHYIVRSHVWEASAYYDVVAMFELLPYWLNFLVAQGLLEPAQQEQARHGLFDLHEKMLAVCKDYLRDPNLHQNLLHWPERAPR